MNENLRVAYLTGYTRAVKTAGIGSWFSNVFRRGSRAVRSAADVASGRAAREAAVKSRELESLGVKHRGELSALRRSGEAENQAINASLSGPEATERWFANAPRAQQQAYVDQVKQLQSAGNKWYYNPMLWAAAPGAVGAGVGAAVDGREGAAKGMALGLGAGLGARFGAGGIIKRLQEIRGGTKALENAKPWNMASGNALSRVSPDLKHTLSSALESNIARRSALLGGAGAIGGGALGLLAGGKFAPKKKEPWYSKPFGLEPIERMPGRLGRTTGGLDALMASLMPQQQSPAVQVNPAADLTARAYNPLYMNEGGL